MVAQRKGGGVRERKRLYGSESEKDLRKHSKSGNDGRESSAKLGCQKRANPQNGIS
jgi:hypothetical protein